MNWKRWVRLAYEGALAIAAVLCVLLALSDRESPGNRAVAAVFASWVYVRGRLSEIDRRQLDALSRIEDAARQPRRSDMN